MEALENLLRSFRNVKVVDYPFDNQKFVYLDLADSNSEFYSCKDAAKFEILVNEHLIKNNAQIAYGGYNEIRNLYSRSGLFKNDSSEERNIHIGMDFWTKTGTTVLAALDGKIHSFKNNSGLGNYGPTIVLEHQFENQIFYTLYGHLALESIQSIEIGHQFNKGQKLAMLGSTPVNGDYAPHLHFQIIRDLEGNFGDYPGVCSKNKLDYYLKNCPDPNFLLKINYTTI